MTANTEPTRLLFVCLGNICRSPAAEAIMREIVARKQNTKLAISIDSAGTAAYHVGHDIDPRMKKALARRGYRETSLARQVKVEDFRDFDHILAMDKQNLNQLHRLCPHASELQKVELMLNYTRHHKSSEVPDPYYGDERDFEHVIDLLEDACQGLLDKLVAAKAL